MKKHIIANHENENIKKRFECPFCPGVFSSTGKAKVVEHCELEHPNWIDYFKNKDMLLKHVVKIANNKFGGGEDQGKHDYSFRIS